MPNDDVTIWCHDNKSVTYIQSYHAINMWKLHWHTFNSFRGIGRRQIPPSPLEDPKKPTIHRVRLQGRRSCCLRSHCHRSCYLRLHHHRSCYLRLQRHRSCYLRLHRHRSCYLRLHRHRSCCLRLHRHRSRCLRLHRHRSCCIKLHRHHLLI